MRHQDVAELRENLAQGQLTPEEVTNLANEYLESNDLERAYPIVSLLAENPQASSHTLMTAGMLGLALSKQEDAVGYFEQILKTEPEHFDANYNLILLELDAGQLDAANERLRKLISVYPDNASLYSDMAVVCLDRGETQTALDSWEKALGLDPNSSLARNNAMELCLEKHMVKEGKRLLLLNARTPGLTSGSVKEIETWAQRLGQLNSDGENTSYPTKQTLPEITGKKIAIFASIDTFVRGIAEHLSVNNELKMFTGGTVDDMRSLMDWADLAWFEWCDNFIIEATKLPKSCQIVCRLHSYEAFSDMPSQVDWSKVDLLIYVNDSVKSIVEKRFATNTPSVVIHNALDGSRFSIPESKTYGKKIASVGYINYKKNPSLLLYCFKKIHEYDREYSLHIAGQHQDPRIQLYFDHFLKSNPLPVYFEGWVDDMASWYADKDFVISTSLFESFHYSIAEGMACGIMPLIHDWYGAEGLYPLQYLFDDPDTCLSLLQKLEQSDRHELARSNREYILERYEISDKLRAISRELAKLVTAECLTVQEKA